MESESVTQFTPKQIDHLVQSLTQSINEKLSETAAVGAVTGAEIALRGFADALTSKAKAETASSDSQQVTLKTIVAIADAARQVAEEMRNVVKVD